ncbi:sugar phosphate isomerase/epimerase family protein [Candidatus Laterigemmans baculatus]|uniref:sugar phosphate isomerase/epimerase family protein n=1 Tax=Candidatus Laterigemmans baculatus TaxID=2770505 RepID=UPI0013DD6A38|nr:sugar phosphate isomerase/epimerase family protein [Candidatus Laterigemmans baculatus]
MTLPRRSFLLASPAALMMGSTANRAEADAAEPGADPGAWADSMRYCFNTSTVRGQQLSVPEQVRLCAAAGYDAIEPWIRDLRAYVEQGGSLTELRKQIEDAGLTVESAIGFATWIVDDEAERRAGLEEARRDMELLAEIGGRRIAAPPIGAHRLAVDAPQPTLLDIAARYRALLELGEQTGVTPQLELWGFSSTLSRLGELAYVAAEAGHPAACVLPDVYHIYKGGSDFAGLALFEASRIHCFHMNDYPATPPRSEIGDADRVYPGDGVAPLHQILTTLRRGGFNGHLSLELFNPSYWEQPAEEVARRGLEKMRAAVRASCVE